MPRTPADTYVGFIKDVTYLNKETDISELYDLMSHFTQYNSQMPFFRETVFFIIDYTRSKHLLMTGDVQGIVGYHPREFLDGGLEFMIDRFIPEDFKVFNERIFKSNYQFLLDTPPAEHSKYLFETNYRLRHKQRSGHITVLQRSTYLTDPETSMPLYAFGVCFDISAFKKDDSIVRKISREDKSGRTELVQTISVDHYFPDQEKAMLTFRETELLKWLAEGLSTKQIADRFSLSFNTVMNHRKNMLRKTNCKNVAELIRFAIRERLI